MAAPGDVVLVLYEEVQETLRLLAELGAVPAEAALVQGRRPLALAR
jgi:hypothetical protein